MSVIFGMPLQLLMSMLLLGLINGAVYALLSLGMAVIFGLLNIINFAHGALFMMGAFVSWMLLKWLGIGYWGALLLTPVIVGAFGFALERLAFSRLYKVDHLYGFLLSFGLTLVIEGVFRNYFGSSGQSYPVPEHLRGTVDLGFMTLPIYRGWVVAISIIACISTWVVIEKTPLGAKLRAATENATLVRAFGVNVGRLISMTFAAGVGLAAFAGVLAAPVYSVSAGMGTNFVIIAFAVVVIGGMGSILGTVVISFGLGVAEGFTKIIYPPASATIVFVLMIVVLLIRPAGLFGKSDALLIAGALPSGTVNPYDSPSKRRLFFDLSVPQAIALAVMLVLIAVLPYFIYPIFLMKVLCFAIFACSFNLLLGYVGLMSFGHAAFFGMGSYVSAWLLLKAHFSTEMAILAGALVGAVLGLVLGWIAIRRRGLYFAMITLGLAQMIYFFCVEAPFTNGEDGIQNVPRGMLFGLFSLRHDLMMYFVVAIIFIAAFLLIFRIVHSPFGEVLKAIRENEPRAVSLGYKVDQYKLVAFVLSSTLAGLAGATKAAAFGLATLTDVHFSMSGEVVLITLLGGLGTIFGPVLGALVLTTLEHALAQMGSWVVVIQGVIFVACVLVFRSGVAGEINKRLRINL